MVFLKCKVYLERSKENEYLAEDSSTVPSVKYNLQYQIIPLSIILYVEETEQCFIFAYLYFFLITETTANAVIYELSRLNK
jgi:hypothetical protein